jgi:hypothetical protein
MLELTARLLVAEGKCADHEARSQAMNIIAKMVGAIVIARALPSDASVKDELLKIVRDGTRADVGLTD